MSQATKARLGLVTISLIWGSTFPLTKMVLEMIPPYYYLSLRYGIAVLIMFLCFRETILASWKRLWTTSIPIGLSVGAGYIFQTAGLERTSASKAAFYTSLSVILVPLIEAICLKKRLTRRDVWCVLLALGGLALLSGIFKETPDFNVGDLLVSGCAIVFAFQIILLDRLPQDCPRQVVVTQQFLVAIALCLPLGAALEKLPEQRLPADIWGMILFLALIATALAFTIMAWAQKHLSAQSTALILILEPVFAALFSWAWLGETLGGPGVIGALLILCSLVISSLHG